MTAFLIEWIVIFMSLALDQVQIAVAEGLCVDCVGVGLRVAGSVGDLDLQGPIKNNIIYTIYCVCGLVVDPELHGELVVAVGRRYRSGALWQCDVSAAGTGGAASIVFGHYYSELLKSDEGFAQCVELVIGPQTINGPC